MKRDVLIVILIFTITISPVFAGTTDEQTAVTDEKTKNKLHLTFSYGAAASWLTRIIKQEERSNFVLKDFFPGLYFRMELQNVPFITPEIRLTAYYPLLFEFNEMPQANSPLNIATDFFAGVRYTIEWGIVKVNAGPGLHFLFLTSDRWYYFNLGAALAAGIELAITPRWSLLIDGFASFDNGNLGANKEMEPFDTTYQYQTSVGARYSKKTLNKKAIFKPKYKPPKEKRRNKGTLNDNEQQDVQNDEQQDVQNDEQHDAQIDENDHVIYDR